MTVPPEECVEAPEADVSVPLDFPSEQEDPEQAESELPDADEVGPRVLAPEPGAEAVVNGVSEDELSQRDVLVATCGVLVDGSEVEAVDSGVAVAVATQSQMLLPALMAGTICSTPYAITHFRAVARMASDEAGVHWQAKSFELVQPTLEAALFTHKSCND